MVQPIKTILEGESSEPIKNQFSQSMMLPLGRAKLRAVELLSSIVSLKKPAIINAASESGVMVTVLSLITSHPWNNVIQLKAHQIFEDVIGSEISKEEKLRFVATSDCSSHLVKMAQSPDIVFSTSGNRIRNGHMGFVIKLANLIVKMKGNYSASDDEQTFERVFSAEWEKFVEGELENSNERNSKNLGGRPTSTTSEDEETH